MIFFIIELQACCGGCVVSRPSRDCGPTSCCGSTLIFSTYQICCAGTIISRPTLYARCCGTAAYNPYKEVTPHYAFYPRKKLYLVSKSWVIRVVLILNHCGYSWSKKLRFSLFTSQMQKKKNQNKKAIATRSLLSFCVKAIKLLLL